METLPPEVPPVVGPLVVPEGVAPLDVAHQLGEVEEAVAEALPLLGGPLGERVVERAVGVEDLRSAASSLRSTSRGASKEKTPVPVIAHDGQGVDLAEVAEE